MVTDAPLSPARPRRAWRAWVIVGAALVAVVGAIALLGGFNEVPIEKLPVIELGETYSGAEVDTTITGSYLTKLQPGYTFEADEGEQFFVVEATIVNTTNTSYVIDNEIVRILLGDDVLPEKPADGVLRAGTNLTLDFLQPGLTTRALYYWRVPDTYTEGDDVVVGVLEAHLIPEAQFAGDVYSYDPMARIITTIGEQL